MPIVFNDNTPIYLQIIEKIKLKIVSKEWRKGDKIPSVRDLALEFGVNPNTMQRSLMQLEEEMLLYSERTSGRYVTQEEGFIDEARNQMAEHYVNEFLAQMESLGLSRKEIKERINGRNTK